jgi:polysaccharide export outer membrane protein
VNLPIIGRVKIAGMNLVVAEEFLEEKYSNYYNDPFVVLEVRNRRIVVFPGQGGDARVIDITNEYVTIIEALAMAGGLSEGGKAHRIKVLRGSLDNPTIYKLDLSTTQGLAEANMYYVKANDIIYVEPSYFAGRQILQTTSQVLSLVSSSILTYFLILQLQNSATP